MDERTTDTDADNDVIEIIPMDEYDSHKAKLRASMAWILGKAYRDDVPKEFSEPFYQTPEGSLNIKPRLANLMVTSELYCQACSSMFGESTSQWKGHWSIIQKLSRKGIYVLEDDETAVTETTLMKTAPFKITAHIALINALMMAYTAEVVSVERVVKAVKKFAAFNASSDLPSDVHDCLVLWINKVCTTVQLSLDKKVKGQQLLQGDSNQKVRIVSRAPRESVNVPLLENLLADIGDGCSLATVVSFYCPDVLKFEDICLKTNVGIADSLYNLQLVRGFCKKHIPARCFHLTYEDFLYTSNNLLPNFYALVAEFFFWFEIKRLDCAAATPGQYFSDAPRPTTAKLLSSAGIDKLPISNVTKKSFYKSSVDDTLVSPTTGSVNVLPRQPLLYKRHQQIQQGDGQVRRSQSLKSPGEREAIQQSILAWEDKQQAARSSEHLARVDESQQSGNLLANVSIDSDMMDSFSDDRLSIELGDLSSDTPPPTLPQSDRNLRDPSHPDYMELQSVTSGATTRATHRTVDGDKTPIAEMHDGSGDSARNSNLNLEPLLPARLKPAKEKTNNHSKAEERGDYKKPTTPPKAPPIKQEATFDSMTSSGISGISDTSSNSSLRDLVTPLSEGQLSDREGYSESFRSRAGAGHSGFTLNTGIPAQMSRSCDSIGGVKSSYTITDQSYTPESARAAGIPVISDSNPAFYRRGSREGSIASSRSSGDYSDHESHKIHCDHKDRESEMPRRMAGLGKSLSTSAEHIFDMQKAVIKTNSLDRPDKQPKKSSFKTSFAEIKRMKQTLSNMDNSSTVYMQQGQDPYDGERQKSAVKDTFQKNKDPVEKKTSFARLPNQTTWQQTTQQQSSAASGEVENGENPGGVNSELLQIKLKLEEKRKMIERKKHRMEAQQQKMRQRLGKTAFLHVVQKPQDEGSHSVANGRLQEQDESLASGDQWRPNSLDQTASSPAVSARDQQRPFSREGIQQTIENVRKKWFQEDDQSPPVKQHSPPIFKEEEASAGHRGGGMEQLDKVVRGSSMERVNPPLRGSSKERVDQQPRGSSIERVDHSYRGSVERVDHAPRGSSMERLDHAPRGSSMERLDHAPRGSSMERLDQAPRGSSMERLDQAPRGSSMERLDQAPRGSSMERLDHAPRGSSIERVNYPSRGGSVDRSGRQEISEAHSEARGGSEERPEDYNSSLDKLNQSLSDLQGEIMRLSLQQEQLKIAKSTPASKQGQGQEKQKERVSASPPEKMSTPVRQVREERMTPPVQEVKLPSSVAGDMGIPTPERLVLGKGDSQYPVQQQPFPTHPSLGQQPLGQYVGMPPVSLHYTGYQPSPYAPHQFPPTPPHAFPQSPPYPSQYTHISPPYSVPPTSHPYGISMSPYHPPPPIASTYSVPSHPGIPLGVPPSHTGAQPFNPVSSASIPQQPVSQAQAVDPFKLNNDSSDTNVPQRETVYTEGQGQELMEDTQSHESDDSSVNSIGQNGFFVSFGDGSPKRNKPKLGKERVRKESTGPGGQTPSQNTLVPPTSRARSVSPQRPQHTEESVKHDSDSNKDTVSTGSDLSSVTHIEQPSVGFVIADQESQDQVSDDMQKKKDKIIQLQIRRREDQERKRQYKELEMNRKREQERLKQEEAERKKQEEKARRELIFRQYQEKKRMQEEEAEGGGAPSRREKPGHTKTRPKSMYVPKTRETEEGLHINSSMEDISAQAFSYNHRRTGTSGVNRNRSRGLAQPKMRKAVSCNTLSTSAEGQLAYGGLTHRRPPSPDLYGKARRGKASTESSDTGSNAGSHTGSDYSGPKLFVKPSSKSNRHIIINAISHCCLAGSVNSDLKAKVLEELAKSDAKHFVILFRDHSCQYRALFEYYPETEDLYKIHGIGPKQLTNKMIEKFLKYNSGGKSFTEVSSMKHISVSIDAVVIHNAMWKTGRGAPKR